MKTSYLNNVEFAIANVQCQYDGSDSEKSEGSIRTTAVTGEHNYDTRDEPPAFIIQQVPTPPTSQSKGPFVEVRPTIMTIGPGYGPSVNVIHVGDRQPTSQSQGPEFNMNKRIRRSEVELRQAADCVSRGLTFQTVSEQFNIPISTIRFFMARKGILPRRRRGRSAQFSRQSTSPEPPFHMQHFKLPNMLALPAEDDPPQT